MVRARTDVSIGIPYSSARCLKAADWRSGVKPARSTAAPSSDSPTIRSSQRSWSPYNQSIRRRAGSADQANGQPGSVYSVIVIVLMPFTLVTRRGLAQPVKLTSAVSTVPAVRPGAVWPLQYMFVCEITCSGGGAPHACRSSVVCASDTSVAS